MKTPEKNKQSSAINSAIIALGSNIEAVTNISLALNSITELGTIVKRTKYIATAAIDTPPGTDDYTNGALILDTDLGLYDLIKKLKAIEDRQGRIRNTIEYHPVSIDLDVVSFNGIIVDKDLDKLPFLQELVRELQPDLLD